MGDDGGFQLAAGATWLNLTATLGSAFGARPVERIPTPERFAAWLHAVELPPVMPPGPDDIEAARALRSTLRELALAHTRGRTPDDRAVAHLQALITTSTPTLTLDAGQLVQAQPENTSEALGRIALQAALHLTGPERHALRECPEHDCHGVFSDPTGRRRWCPSPTCANRGRVRAHRARHRTESPPSMTNE